MDDLKGFVYFIHSPSNGMVKIGYSDGHPSTRLRRLRATCPVPLDPLGYVRGGRSLEMALHGRFVESWSHGEWFRETSELMDLIWNRTRRWDYAGPKFRRQLPVTTPGETDEIERFMTEYAQDTLEWASRTTWGGVDAKEEMVLDIANRLKIPIHHLIQWRREGIRVDLIGYYEELREKEKAERMEKYNAERAARLATA